VWRNRQFPLLPHNHTDDTLVPALDDLSHAERDGKGAITTNGGIKLIACSEQGTGLDFVAQGAGGSRVHFGDVERGYRGAVSNGSIKVRKRMECQEVGLMKKSR